MSKVIGIVLLLGAVGFAVYQVYHLVIDIKARKNKK